MQDFVFFKGERDNFKLKFSQILYIQANRKHVAIVTCDGVYVSVTSISSIEQILPRSLFCRVHRSYIISLEHTDKYNNELIYIGNKKIPLAERYKNVLKKAITMTNCNAKYYQVDDGNVDQLLRDLNLQ
jgi:DNA-binding LytR/AlgR family response regulator